MLTNPKLYWIMIGKTDFFYPRMNSYCRYLHRKGYRHEYFVSPGEFGLFDAEGVAEELMFQSATPVLSKIFLKEITIFFASN